MCNNSATEKLKFKFKKQLEKVTKSCKFQKLHDKFFKM